MQQLFWALIFSLGWLGTSAQISIYIEDKTQNGFKLVANGYLQNAVSSPNLYLKNLPTESEVFLHFIMNTRPEKEFGRPLTLKADGIYHYVIMTNFKGKTQLRYRGRINQVPEGLESTNFKKLIAYAPALQKLNQKPAKEPHATAQAPVNPTATTPSEKQPAEATPQAKPASFEQSFTQFKQIEFEFEKLRFAKESLLNFKLNIEQAVQVMKGFKYDQTRMQFLEALLKKQPGLRFSGDLLKATFEYELSRQQASNLLK